MLQIFSHIFTKQKAPPEVSFCVPVLHTCSLNARSGFHDSQTQHYMEVKRTSIDFTRQVTEDYRSSWPQTMGNQLINRSPYIRYTIHNYFLL